MKRDCGNRKLETLLIAFAKFAAVLGVLAFVVFVTSIISPPISHAAFQGENGMIAFGRTLSGQNEIFVMNADGSGQTNLTNNPANENVPAWSPDGTKIAFDTNRDGNTEIYVMNPDGTGQTNITNNPADDSSAAWCPDGKIVFASYRDGNWEIYVMNADGTGQTNLTNNSGQDDAPACSPDGTKIAFMSYRDGNWEIYVMNADGTGQTNLTNNPYQDDSPNWSPDGAKIMFGSQRLWPGESHIFTMNPDGTNQTKVNTPGFAFDPAWSPDGTKIAYYGKPVRIHVINVDGTGDQTIGNVDTNDAWADWQPLPTATAQCTPPHSGMVAWWPGDNSAIDIVGGNNGTLVNGATFAPGKVEQAFSFDGVDQFVQAADSASLDVPTAITLDAWINTADPSASQPIMAKAQASGNWNSYYFAIGGDGNLYFEVDNISVGHYGVWRTSFSPSANTWYHVAATWQNVNGDGTDTRIYINAVDQSAPLALNQGYDSGFALYYTSLPFYVGRSEMGSSYFKGLVDEVEIFDRALTAEEIAAIYVAGSAGKCKELFTITASAPGGHGKISCKPATVNYGNGSSCTISPDIGYHLQSLTDNADDVTGSVVNNKYDLSNITDNHNIVARFEMRNGPDLRGNWIDLAYYKKIKSLKVNVKIQNIGNRNARDFVVSFYLSSNGRDPDTLLRNITVNGLSAGKSRVLSLEYRSKCQLSGKYLVVVIDSKKQVNELNENNNRMVRLIH